MSFNHYKPSKTEAREFAARMNEINDFCNSHGIDKSANSDSYYFIVRGRKYRVSNHSIEASNRNGNFVYHPNGREDDVIYIHASKTRIIDIYNDIEAGYKLDGRGNRLEA